LPIIKGPIEIEVKLQAGKLKQLGQHEFDLQTRRFDPLFCEELATPLNRIQNSHVATLLLEQVWE
jgi:hypothetical protein